MKQEATVSLFHEIDAYIKKNQQVIASGNTDLRRKISKETLHLATAITAITDSSQAATLFSGLLGRDITVAKIVPLITTPSQIPEQPTFAYELDYRGWIFVKKDEKKVHFVDNALLPFAFYKAGFESQTHIIWYIISIIFVVLLLLSVFFY